MNLLYIIYSDFDKFYNPIHGNCFIFNSGWRMDKEVSISRNTGRRYGILQYIFKSIDIDKCLK